MQPNSDEMDDDVSESGGDQVGSQTNGGNTRKRWNTAAKEDGPACQSCRRRKAKCSRRQPCSQCERNNMECIYDECKSKPGMRAGAIDHLNQRLATLENMFLGQGMVWQQILRHLESAGDKNTPNSSSTGDTPSASLDDTTTQLRESLMAMADGDNTHPPAANTSSSHPPKRRRTSHNGTQYVAQPFEREPNSVDYGQTLPPPDLVDALVKIYFERMHPWIPILHYRQFRQTMADTNRRQELSTIFYAIVSLCVRFSDDPRLGDAATRAALSKRSREIVILRSMESFSVMNLQALVICAFDTIASGRGPSAWSIVGSMTRTAEQLQLSVEDEDKPQSATASNGVITRIAFLPPAKNWIEEEERRRVFWNIFLMDRFCSISTGWNLSLTSADAQRRLPCEGGLWEAGEPLSAPTPYFGVSDQPSSKDCPLPTGRPETDDQNLLGGFAYCIEATESLSLVTSFFLHQAVDVTRGQDVQLWLMRFKQLDLRLVQWKVYLPERWVEACAVNADGNMDPNLTLAHITHNTAVVLLHQGIAYPSAELQSTPIKLPSQSSAETCLAAAIEVATIAEQFLRNSRFLANHQFAFCLFVCGRMLLAHSAYYHTGLAASFDSLIESLREISRRWSGVASSQGSGGKNGDLASKFASRLSESREYGATTFDIRQAAYSDDGRAAAAQTGDKVQTPQHDGSRIQRHDWVPSPAGVSHPVATWKDGDPFATMQEASPDSISLAFPPLPQAFQAPSTNQTRAPSPLMAMNHGGVGVFGIFGGAPTPGGPPGMMDNTQRYQGFEDVSNYLDGSFLPDQRVSMFSQSGAGAQ